MPAKRDPVRLAVEVGIYAILGWFAMAIAAGALTGIAGYLVGITAAVFSAALLINWLTLSIYEHRPLADIGLHLRRESLDNLLYGLAGGIVTAILALAPPLIVGAARIVPTPAEPTTTGTFLFVTFFLALGAAGEEILFRGYGFQLLLANLGPLATIAPIAVLFASLHAGNPNATYIGLANTAGFGILFGYAFLRSRDLWLPIGLHFGWNFTLPVFGVNVSGLRMKMTGYEMVWSAGKLWSGGDYGPEASILATAAMVALAVYLWKAPIRRQASSLLDPPVEVTPCEPEPPSPY